MKCKYGFLSAAFVAASVLLGSQEASAGGNGWWGRAGYGNLVRVREVYACIDDITAELRVAVRALNTGWCGGEFAVAADLWGAAVCTLPALPPGPAFPPVYEPCGALVVPPVILPPPGPLTELVAFDGFPTYETIALRESRDWYYADFDLRPLIAGSCAPGFIDDLHIDLATIYIQGRPFVLDYDLPLCGDDWYGGW